MLGQRIQLGHDGTPCPSPRLSTFISTVLHTNGIHSVCIDNCACQEGQNVNITAQYLRLGLWPATVFQPRTAVTIQLLEFYHQLTLQSKVNLYDFYWTLSRLTSNTDDSLVPVCCSPPLPLSNISLNSLHIFSINTKSSADVSANSDTLCSSNVVVLPILPFPSPHLLLALVQWSALAALIQAAIFHKTGCLSYQKIGMSSSINIYSQLIFMLFLGISISSL